MRLVMEEYGYRAGISVQLRDEDRLILYGSKVSDSDKYHKSAPPYIVFLPPLLLITHTCIVLCIIRY